MNILRVNQPNIEVKVYLTKNGVAVTGEAKPTLYCIRYPDFARTVVPSGFFTWTEVAAGLYHINIADAGTAFGGADDMIARFQGQLMFMIDAVANFDIVNRTFEVKVPDKVCVSGTGSDTVGDGSFSLPYLTIDKGIKALMGWDGTIYDRFGECVVHVLDYITLPNSAINYMAANLNVVFEGPKDGSVQVSTGGVSSSITCYHTRDIHFNIEHAVNNFLTVGNVNNCSARFDASVTGYAFGSLANSFRQWDGISMRNAPASLTDCILNGDRILHLKNLRFDSCSCTNLVRTGSSDINCFIQDMATLWSNVTNVINVGSTSKMVLQDVYTDGSETNFKSGSGSYELHNKWELSEVADAVLDELLAGHTTAGSLGKAVSDIEADATAIKAVTDLLPDAGALNDLAAILVDTGTTLPAEHASLGAGQAALSGEHSALTAEHATIDGKVDIVDTVVDAIKAVTDLIPDAGAMNDLAAILVDTGTTIPGLIAALNDITAADVDTVLTASHDAGSWAGVVATSVNLNDNDATKLVIAKALKDQDASGTDSVAGSLNSLGKNWENVVVDQVGYDGRGNPLSQRVRIFPTKTAADAGTGAIATYTITMTFKTNNTLATRKVTLNP